MEPHFAIQQQFQGEARMVAASRLPFDEVLPRLRDARCLFGVAEDGLQGPRLGILPGKLMQSQGVKLQRAQVGQHWVLMGRLQLLPQRLQ